MILSTKKYKKSIIEVKKMAFMPHIDHMTTSDEEAVLTFNTSKMILAEHSDASYLSEPKAQSRVGGHFFVSNDTNTTKQWCSAQHSTHNQTCNVVGNRGRACCKMHHGMQGNLHSHCPRRNGTQTTSHTGTDRQCNGGRSDQREGTTKTNKGNGH